MRLDNEMINITSFKRDRLPEANIKKRLELLKILSDNRKCILLKTTAGISVTPKHCSPAC